MTTEKTPWWRSPRKQTVYGALFMFCMVPLCTFVLALFLLHGGNVQSALAQWPLFIWSGVVGVGCFLWGELRH